MFSRNGRLDVGTASSISIFPDRGPTRFFMMGTLGRSFPKRRPPQRAALSRPQSRRMRPCSSMPALPSCTRSSAGQWSTSHCDHASMPYSNAKRWPRQVRCRHASYVLGTCMVPRVPIYWRIERLSGSAGPIGPVDLAPCNITSTSSMPLRRCGPSPDRRMRAIFTTLRMVTPSRSSDSWTPSRTVLAGHIHYTFRWFRTWSLG